jgi:uncharacterized membrane protein
MLLLLLLGSAMHALYLVATRWIGRYDDPATSIVYSALMGSLIMTLVLPFSFVWPRDGFDFAMLCSLGLIGALGHYLVIRAFRHGPAAVIAPLSYVELVGTAALGYLIFDHFPDVWTWIGAAIIIASGVYIALRERRLRALRQPGLRDPHVVEGGRRLRRGVAQSQLGSHERLAGGRERDRRRRLAPAPPAHRPLAAGHAAAPKTRSSPASASSSCRRAARRARKPPKRERPRSRWTARSSTRVPSSPAGASAISVTASANTRSNGVSSSSWRHSSRRGRTASVRV